MFGEPDIEGATAALINGFRKMEKHIDLSPYRMETSAAQDLAVEVSDFYGDNPYFLSSMDLLTKMKYGAKNNVFDPHSWLV